MDVNGNDNQPEWGWCKAPGCQEAAFPIWEVGAYPDDPDLLLCEAHLGAEIARLRDQAAKAETAQRAWTEIGARSEAAAAALRAAAEIVRSEYSVLLERPLPDVYAVMQHLRWPVGHLALTAEIHNAGAALLAELEAALAGLQAAWDALSSCVDEFEPSDMSACSEHRDALDTAILTVLAAWKESR